ncbi:MAG: hypothetical protein P8K77_00195 [Polaribacter sp.]|nr:hypothetical protein [Polaribacter sp.]
MKRINIFDKEHVNLFCYPGDGIEFLHSVLFSLGYTYKGLFSQKAKKDGLFVIEELFKLDLIYVFHWGKNHDEMKNNTYTIKETLKYIDSIWFGGADYPDFYGMVMFGHKKWYLKELEKLGMTDTTDWKEFVKHKIGNLEQWIEENRPK